MQHHRTIKRASEISYGDDGRAPQRPQNGRKRRDLWTRSETVTI